MVEKRKFLRFDLSLSAICQKDGIFKELEVTNFCKEGVGIISDELFDKGEHIKVELIIPEDTVPVCFDGDIAWTRKMEGELGIYKSGLRLSSMSNSDKGRMLEYVYNRWLTLPKRSGMEAGTEAK